MLRFLSAVVVAIALNAFIAVSSWADWKGIYEGPMVDYSTGTESPSSEGKISRDGLYKVEISLAPADTYKLCIDSLTGTTWLGTITLSEAGELMFEGDLGSGLTLVTPSFRIFTGGTAGQCDGTEAYRSGLAIL